MGVGQSSILSAPPAVRFPEEEEERDEEEEQNDHEQNKILEEVRDMWTLDVVDDDEFDETLSDCRRDVNQKVFRECRRGVVAELAKLQAALETPGVSRRHLARANKTISRVTKLMDEMGRIDPVLQDNGALISRCHDLDQARHALGVITRFIEKGNAKKKDESD